MSTIHPTPREKARAALESVTPALRYGMRTVLTTPIEKLNLHWEAAEFEVCPMFFGVTAIPLDEGIVPDLGPDLISNEVFDDETVCDVFGDVVMEWLADTWKELGGAAFPFPGRSFFHGYSERFDFALRDWLKNS